LYLRPNAVRPLASELAERLRPFGLEVICGPLIEGAFVGIMVAEALGVEFVYADRVAAGNTAGSAVRGTLTDLRNCGANVVAIGTLLSLGPRPAELAAENSLALESLEPEPNLVWDPTECPLCAASEPLTRFPGR
jgi:orotate phosphoribosyltransferase